MGDKAVLKRRISVLAIACGLVPLVSFGANIDAGSYLAGKHAGMNNAFEDGVRYFARGLIADPKNANLLENAMTSYLALGLVDRAVPVAQAIVSYGYESQIANLVLSLHAVKTRDWGTIFDSLGRGRSVGPLVDGLSQAWAHLGKGEMRKAIDSFDQVIADDSMRSYGLTHKAYALAMVGDFEGADAIFSETVSGPFRYNRRSAIAHAQILSQLGRNDEAVTLLDGLFAGQMDPELTDLRTTLAAGSAVGYDVVNTATEGMADVYFLIAGAVQGDTADAYTLLYARAANYLAPDLTQAVLLTAGLLDDLNQYDLAVDTYADVSRDDPSFHGAELGRAEAMRKAGRNVQGIEVLEALSQSHADMALVHASLGDALRRESRFDAAIAAYTKALDLYSDSDAAAWFVYYTRGISYHKKNEWSSAENDFRAALKLNPKQPQVLNYLGYSLVERGEKLDEALEMIEAAATARPDNGAIIDSLGWVLFRLGHFEEAVGHLEHAASLLPVDPTINDHLGDAYWAVGRKTEARFQWQRALSFEPEEEAAASIRAKLESGLDIALQDSGGLKLQVASGDD